VKAGLIHQLHERLQFVKPPDAIVGALLLDLGDLLGREPSGMGGAYSVFKLAKNYLDGLPNVGALQKRVEDHAMVAEFDQRTPGGGINAALLSFFIPAGFLLTGLVMILKKLRD
jgi:hypothetical protein